MCEILFRGRQIDNGDWVEGDLIQLYDGRKYIVNNKHGACIDDKGNFINTEEPFVCAVDPSTVGQYTGLKDRNGVRIFEGDIIKATYRGNYGRYAFDVAFDDGRFVLRKDGVVVEMYDGYRPEVIGNIHDNPELIEV